MSNVYTQLPRDIPAVEGSNPPIPPLPTGASTSALQVVGNASLASIDSKLTAPLAVTGPLTDAQLRATPVPVSGTIAVSGTVPISAAALPLPAGAATSALQTSGNASLASIDSKLTAPLTVTGPLTDAQLRAAAVPVSATSLPLPTGAATEASLVKLPLTQASTTAGQSGVLVQGATRVADPSYTDLSTNPLSLNTGGYLRVTMPWHAQGSATAGEFGNLVQGAVTSGNPVYTNGQTSPLSLTTAGLLRVDGSAVTQPVSLASTTITGTVAVTGPLTDTQLRASAVPVSVAALPLPAGGSTSALQTSGNASLASIDGKLALNYGASAGSVRTAAQIGNSAGVADFAAGNSGSQTLRVVVASDQPALAITAASLPLPAGAATSTLQTAGNASLSSIDTKLTSPLTVTGPLTDTQLRASAVPVSVAALPLPAGGATSALQTTGNSSLASIDSKLTLNYGSATAAIRTASQLGNTTGQADFGAGVTGAQTLRAAANLYDSSGVGISSTLVGGDQRLDVNLAAEGSVAPGTAGTTAVLGGAQFNTVLPTLTTTQQAALQSDAAGRLIVTNVPLDGSKQTYSAANISIALAALTTDFFTITGSASKTIRITRIALSLTGGGSVVNMQLVKRSTANTLGTSTVTPAVPHDSANAAATAVVRAYTANPTLGTLIGSMYAVKIASGLASSAVAQQLQLNFGDGPKQAIVLKGSAQVLSFNANGVTGATNASCEIEWTEE